MAGQTAQALGAEDVGHPAHRLLQVERAAVGGRDARRLLAAVLERVETEIGDVGGLGMVPDPEEPALVVELVVTPCGAQNRSSTRVRRGPAPRPRSCSTPCAAAPARRRSSRSTATGWPTPPSTPRTHAAAARAPPPSPATGPRRTAPDRAARSPAASRRSRPAHAR